MPRPSDQHSLNPSIAKTSPLPALLAPKQMGAFNTIGFWTLYRKETQRFLKVFLQTVAAPVIQTLLFYVIFALSLGGVVRSVKGVSYLEFLAPGLIMMGMAQNAFANTSSSILIAKVQGNIVDVLMPPLSPFEFTLAYSLGGVTRGLIVGAATALTIMVFVPLNFMHGFYIVYHAIMGTLLLSLLGLIGGIWAEKFDHIAAVTNFIVVPLTFLSGTFYSLTSLPQIGQDIGHLNPFFYMIDGFRYGFIGQKDGGLSLGIGVMALSNLILWVIAQQMVARGYKQRS
jgi:ABC-2 type transport system permease protein